MALPQTKLNCSLSQVRNSASYALKGAVKDTSHSLSGNNYVGAKSFGHDPRKSVQALRYNLNGERTSIFNRGTRESLNYVAGPTVGPQVYGPSKMQQTTEVITAATGLFKTILDGIGELNKTNAAARIRQAASSGSFNNTTLHNEAGNYASNIGNNTSTSSLISSMKNADNTTSLSNAISAAQARLDNLNLEMRVRQLDENQANTNLSTAQTNYDNAAAKVETKEKAVKVAQDTVNQKQTSMSAIEKEGASLEPKLGEAIKSYSTSVAAKAKAETAFATASAACFAAEATLASAETTLANTPPQIDDGNGGKIANPAYSKALEARNNAEAKLEEAQTNMEQAEIELDKAKDSVELNKQNVSDIETAVDANKVKLAKVKEDFNRVSAQLEKAQEDLAKAKTELESAKQEEANAKKKLDDAKSDVAKFNDIKSLDAEIKDAETKLKKLKTKEDKELTKLENKLDKKYGKMMARDTMIGDTVDTKSDERKAKRNENTNIRMDDTYKEFVRLSLKKANMNIIENFTTKTKEASDSFDYGGYTYYKVQSDNGLTCYVRSDKKIISEEEFNNQKTAFLQGS